MIKTASSLKKVFSLCRLAAVFLGLATSAFALDPFDMQCAEGSEGQMTCTVTQYASSDDISGRLEDGNGFPSYSGELSSWDDVAAAWDEVRTTVENLVDEGNFDYSYVELRLGSDIDFDPIDMDHPSCESNVASISLEEYNGEVFYHLNGNGKTVSYFCQAVNGENAGFISMVSGTNVGDAGLQGKVFDLTFDRAFVSTDGSVSKGVAVIAQEAIQTLFKNVSVKNSKVSGYNTGSVAFQLTSCAFESVTVSNVDMDVPEVFSTTEISSTSKQGGVAAYAKNTTFSDLDVSDVSISFSMSHSSDDNLLSGAREMGGVFGEAAFNTDLSASSNSFTATNVTMTNGSIMGGAYGALTGPEGLNHSIINSSVTGLSAVAACIGDVFVGGLVGSSAASYAFKGNKVSSGTAFSYYSYNCDTEYLERYDRRFVHWGGILGADTTGFVMLFYGNEVSTGITSVHEDVESVSHDYIGGLAGRLDVKNAIFLANAISTNLSSGFSVETDAEGDLTETDGAWRTYAYVGGVAGYVSASEKIFARDNSVEVPLSIVASTTDAEAMHVGGIFGYDTHSGSGFNYNLVQSNLVKGKISAMNNGGVEYERTGALVGYHDASLVFDKIEYNLYISDSEDPIRFVGDGKSFNDSVVSNNYRNEVADFIDITGFLKADGSGSLVDENGDNVGHSGVISWDEINSQKFLYVMNTPDNYRIDYCFETFCPGYEDFKSVRWVNDLENPRPTFDEDNLPLRLTLDVTKSYESLSGAAEKALKPFHVVETKSDGGETIQKHYLYDFIGASRAPSTKFTDALNEIPFDFVLVNGDGIPEILENIEEAKTLTMEFDYELKVSYEIMAVNSVTGTREAVPLEEYDPYMVFFIPKTEFVKTSGTLARVPEVMSGDSILAPQEYYINCKENAADCTPIESSYSSPRLFSDLTADFWSRYSGSHTDTLHLVYGVTDDYAEIYVAGRPEQLKLVSYGVDYDAEISFAYMSAEVQTLAWGSRFAPGARNGYRIKSWSADIWLSDWENFDAEDVVGCYGGQPCKERITVDLSGNGIPLGNEDDLISRMETLPEGGALRWSMKNLEPDAFIELIDFQSAAIKTVGSDKVPLIYVDAEEELIKYHVTFEPEMSSDYFYSMINGELDWKDSAVYDVEMDFDLRMFPRVYMVGNYAGWSYDDRDPRWEFSESEVEYYDENPILRVKALVREDGQGGSGDDGIPGAFLRYEDGAEYLNEKGEVHLTQYLHPDMPMDPHKFDDAGMMAIPNEEVNFPFVVEPHPYRGYKIDSLWSTYSTMNDNEPVRVDLMPEDSRNIVINPMNVFNWMLHARYASIRYDLVFNLDRNKENLHLLDWADSLTLYVDDGKEHDFPTLAFNNDGCILGWKNAKSDSLEFTSEDEGFTTLDHWYDNGVWPVYRSLVEGRNELHAVWADAARCDTDVYGDDERSGSYSRVVFDTVGGVIELRMLLRDDDGTVIDSILLNSPGKDYVLVPSNFNGEDITVHFASKPGFEVPDSVLVYRDLSRNAYDDSDEMELMGSIHDGDSWPFSWDFAYVSAKFISQDSAKLAFEKFGPPEVYGVSAQLKLSTNKFSVDRDVKMRVSLMDALGNELDAMVVDKITRVPFDTAWSVYPLTPGEYVMKGMMWDARDTAITEEDHFTVAAEIAANEGGWKMVSLSDVVKDSVNWTDGDQLFFWWDEQSLSGEYWQYRNFGAEDTVSRLQGYWYNTMEGRSLAVNPKAQVAQDFEWVVDSAYTGWNMVANPYDWAIKVPDSIVAVSWDSDASDYRDDPTLIKPYEAIWVWVNKKTKIPVDARPYFGEDENSNKPLEKRATLKAAGHDNWTIQAVLKDNRGHLDSWNVLGVGDSYEIPEPPSGMGDHVELFVKDGKKRLAKSIVAPSDELSWSLNLQATGDRVGYLSFAGLESLAGMGFHIYVTVDGRTTEMRSGDSVRVMLKASGSSAQVEVSRRARVITDKPLEGLHFVQSGTNLNVGFTVDEKLAGARMVVDVLSMDGQVMATYAGKAVAGSNLATLDAPKTGLYMLRVRVANEQNAGKILVK